MSKRPLSPSRDEPTAKCARVEDALTWDTLLVELRKLIQCYLHKRDKLSLARTSKLNWRERSNVEAAWTVNDALHAWHQSNMPRPTVDTGVAVAAFSFAAFCLRQSLTKPPWHIIYKNDPTLYTFMDSVYVPNRGQLMPKWLDERDDTIKHWIEDHGYTVTYIGTDKGYRVDHVLGL